MPSKRGISTSDADFQKIQRRRNRHFVPYHEKILRDAHARYHARRALASRRSAMKSPEAFTRLYRGPNAIAGSFDARTTCHASFACSASRHDEMGETRHMT